MKNWYQKSLFYFLGISLILVSTLSAFGQKISLQDFNANVGQVSTHSHSEKCAHTLIEAQQEKELGVLGSKAVFEDWINQKIAQKNRQPQLLMTQAVPRVIPVVVHVIHNGTAVGVEANISDAQILEQIRILNEDFRRLNADANRTPTEFLPVAADANIEFILAKQDPNGLPTNGIVRRQGTKTAYAPEDATLIGQLSQWNPEEYLNIWVVPLVSPYLGYATFPTSNLPGLNFAPTAAIRDGVTVDYRFFGMGPGTAVNTKGRTATHEVGHYFGLRHIWGDGGCEVDDFVLDTPNQDNPNNICNVSYSRFSCGNVNMIQNYMDYTPDACMNLFTKGQVDRFDVVLANSPRRVTLVNNRATRDPQLSTRDVSLLKVVTPSDALCQTIIAPQVEVQNRGNDLVSSVTIEFRWNGRLIETKRFATNLRTTEKAILSFGNLDTNGESNEFAFTIVQVNDLADLVPSNNSLSTKPVQQGQLTLPYSVSLSTLPSTWIIGNPDQSLTWEKTTLTLDGVAQPSLFIR
ncbi:MAG: zinc metalloprotease, partial [Cyclobacteriaceae bacterium]|nr:zinc metalloprotease [Cyclobacteriaceae bacterium]